jgi:hypothetical protein
VNADQAPKPKLQSNMGKLKHKIPTARTPIDVVHDGACSRANERTIQQDSLADLLRVPRNKTHYDTDSQNAETRQ